MTETTGEVELYISAFSSLSMQYKGDIVCFREEMGSISFLPTTSTENSY